MLILASASGARRSMLENAGLSFTVDAADIDETAVKNAHDGPPEQLAPRLAEAKARTISARHPGALVIGADQLLELDGVLFDKPRDLADARAHLMLLRGRTHRLISAAAVVQDGHVLWTASDEARLTMRAFSEGFLGEYLAKAGVAVRNTVGAYHLEGLGATLFEAVDGNHFTILGLPLLPLLAFLRARGVCPS